ISFITNGPRHGTLRTSTVSIKWQSLHPQDCEGYVSSFFPIALDASAFVIPMRLIGTRAKPLERLFQIPAGHDQFEFRIVCWAEILVVRRSSAVVVRLPDFSVLDVLAVEDFLDVSLDDGSDY